VGIDKVVIEGAEFTRVGERYLLQTEVERVLSYRAGASADYIQSLTQLLEEMVRMANQMTMEIVEVSTDDTSHGTFALRERSALLKVRDALREQLSAIEEFLAERGQ
jgi:hypothetical protein